MLRYVIMAENCGKQALRGIAPTGPSLAMLCKDCSAEAFFAEIVPRSHRDEAQKQRGAAASLIQSRHHQHPTPFLSSLANQEIGSGKAQSWDHLPLIIPSSDRQYVAHQISVRHVTST